ncbi:hypothetical protein D6C86_07676 [Aureobasidium pullulans]|nr:hypothetical protein D6C86_07676 [Aureobasidium pullulans]
MPLFISAFEHYEEELRGFKRFFRYEQEVCRCRSRLLVQYATLSQTLEYLLTELTDKDELDGMITRGYGKLWEDSDMSDKLQQQLGTAYESFCIVLAQIFDDMEQLATVLDIERKERITGPQLARLVETHKLKQALPRQSPQSFRYVYEFEKKLRFSHKGRHIRPLLDSLERHNGQLGTFTEKSKRLSKARLKASGGALSTPLHHVRESAERLHRALAGTWTCSQHASHVVNLMLDPRIHIPDSNTREQDSLDSVGFFLTVPSFVSPHVFRSLQVHVLHDTGTSTRDRDNLSFVVGSPATTLMNVTSLPRVKCLCTVMEGSQSQKCIGFCLDHQEQLLGNYPLSQALQNGHNHCSGPSKSLKDIISSHIITSRRRKPFTSFQACHLGLTIASSFLQLGTTPWLCGQWRAEDVYFIQQATAPKTLDVQRPFIRQTYLTTAIDPIQANPNSMAMVAASTGADDRYAFLRLGIMLLEIFSGEPFPSSQNPPPGDQMMVDLLTVFDWVEQQKGYMTKAFYKAISACISWFADPRTDLQNDEFKREFLDKLIIPLRDELEVYVSPARSSGP